MNLFKVRYIVFFYLLCLSGPGINAQEFTAGIKGGVNYSFNKLAAQVDGTAGSFSTNSKPGFQGGIFYEWKSNKFFLRPEAFYSHAEGEFPFPNNPAVYSINKLSFPLLLGYNVYGPLDVYAGPAYQYFLDVQIQNVPDFENQQSNLAAQFGIKVEFERFEIDLRYDFTFDSKENQRIDIPGLMNDAFFDDGRLNQLMLSLNFKIFDSQNPWVLARGGSCYL